MSKRDYPTTRKATAIVKCPHCDHTGSARGLFSHVRMSHPGVIEKPKTATKIMAHPYDIKGMGHVKDRIHRIEKSALKKTDQDWIVVLVIGLIEKIMLENGLLPSKGYKPSAIGSIEPKKKRKYYGE